MKILHVTPTYYPAVRYGGPIFAVHGLCKALVARGHEVTVFTTNVDGDGVLDVPLARPVELDGVQVHYFPSPLRRLYWSPAMRRALTRVREFDIVHSHAVYLWPGVAAAAAARAAAVPYVISPRGMLVPSLIRRKNAVVKRVWLSTLERRAFQGAAAIHFTSSIEWSEAEHVGLPLPDPVVIPNGIDLVTRPDVPRETDTLLFLGRLSWKKRLDKTIELVAGLRKARLIIAGFDDENLTPSLEALARRFGVNDRVAFVGPVHGNARYELLARATVFVLLSESENFGNAVVEALMMETPVILSPAVGIAPDAVAAGAGTTDPGAIEMLLDSPEQLRAMGQRGRSLVKDRFAWSCVAAAMERAYLRSTASLTAGSRI